MLALALAGTACPADGDRNDIDENKLTAAAAQVRQGIAYLKDEMRKIKGSSQSRLQEVVDMLDRTGIELEAGRLDKAAVDKAFAAAYRTDVETRWVTTMTEEWVPLLDQPEIIDST